MLFRSPGPCLRLLRSRGAAAPGEGHRPESAVTRPARNGVHGHPIVVAGRLREEMMDVSDATEGLLGVLRAHASEIGEVDAGDLLDLCFNTPEEYQAARQRFGLGS